MPMTSLERYEASAASTGDWLAACRATFSKQLSKAIGTIRLILSRGKLLASQNRLAICTYEALSMPRLIFESDTSSRHDFFALCTFGRKLFLKTAHAVHVGLVGDYERLGPNLDLAHHALKALVVPLARFVFHLLHARPERVPARIAPGGELGIVASGTENERILGRKWFLHQAHFATTAFKAVLVPMQIFVRHVFGVQADPSLAHATGMREILLVARNATGMLVGEDVAAAGETLVAGDAYKMLSVKIFAQGLCVLSCKDKLVASSAPGLEVFRVVPLAVEAIVEDAVRQVYQELVASGTRKAAGMPVLLEGEPRSNDSKVSPSHCLLALFAAMGRFLGASVFRDDDAVANV